MDLLAFVLPLFLSIILHEMAHGWMALMLGDTTAKRAGRLTLNPIAHVDPVGSLLVPGILFMSNAGFMFGWAKPVPVNFAALHHPKKDMGLVAVAGPGMNLILAVLFAVSFKSVLTYSAPTPGMTWLAAFCQYGILINLSLCAFNLFPLLPLDGGRIVTSLLPMKWAVRYSETEKYGFLVLMVILIGFPLLGDAFGYNLDIISTYMSWMMKQFVYLFNFIL